MADKTQEQLLSRSYSIDGNVLPSPILSSVTVTMVFAATSDMINSHLHRTSSQQLGNQRHNEDQSGHLPRREEREEDEGQSSHG